MKRKLVLAAAFAATIAGVLAAGTNIINATERPSVTSAFSMKIGGLTRSWQQITPVAPLAKPAPIIVVLGGVSEPVNGEIERDNLVPYADAGKAELVYPIGYRESWNAGGCCGWAAKDNIDDIAFMKALAARVNPGHKHPLYVVGYSNGGRLAYRMACSDPGIFDATVIVKAMPMSDCRVTRPQTVMQIAALDDTAVPYKPGLPGKESPPATVQAGRLLAADRCTGPAVTSSHGEMIYRTWSNCGYGARVGFAVWKTGGHSFPFPKKTTPGAAPVIWSFFTQTPITAPLPA
jgi:polyhydroxybutyrate depolymerase